MPKTLVMTPEKLEINNRLLNFIMNDQGIANDAALSRALHLNPPTISKIRSGRQDLTDTTLIAIMEHLHYDLPTIRKIQAGTMPTVRRTATGVRHVTM